MKAVIQRVGSASVRVAQTGYEAHIDAGLCVLLAIEEGDGPHQATWMANKIAHLRIFADDEGRMNRSVQDVGGSVLLISQFTLVGDCSGGHRPSFVTAAEPTQAADLVESVGTLLGEAHGLPVESGVFGAMMEVSLLNDGPVTLIVERA